MSKRVPKVNRGGRPRKIRLPQLLAEEATLPSSLPLAADAAMTLPASDSTTVPTTKLLPGTSNPNSTWWKAPPNSKIRKTALKIVALRIRGFSDADIANAVGLASGQMVRSYLYKAHKNGWLTDELDNPKDKVEYEIGHKLVRNMHEALDSTDPKRKDVMTVEVAKMTIAKQFDPQVNAGAQTLNVLSIRLEQPSGPPMPVRDGTMGGAPSYIEGETVGVGDGKG